MQPSSSGEGPAARQEVDNVEERVHVAQHHGGLEGSEIAVHCRPQILPCQIQPESGLIDTDAGGSEN